MTTKCLTLKKFTIKNATIMMIAKREAGISYFTAGTINKPIYITRSCKSR